MGSPPFVVFGELYQDGTFDDRNDPFIAGILDVIFAEMQIDVSLDGDLVLSGTPAELSEYSYGFTDAPLYFDEPIFYEEPIDRGGPSPAIAALWTSGVRAVYHPLSPGDHTLQVVHDDPFFGFFDITYHIDVETRGGSSVPEPTSLSMLALSGSLLFLLRRRAGR